jgi:predicted AAA+ superfamily ATPase
MLNRKALDLLTAWKVESNGSTAMLIEGARRVGKSYLAEQFGQTQYASYLTVDFSFAPDEVRNCFLDLRGDLNSFFLQKHCKILMEAANYGSIRAFLKANLRKIYNVFWGSATGNASVFSTPL